MARHLLLLFSHSVMSLCNPTDCNIPGFPVLHYLLMSIELVMPSDHPSSVISFSPCLQPFSASRAFPMCCLFPSGGQSIGASSSASVLPMNIHGWFILGLTDLISLLFKRLSRVFSSTTVWKHKFFSTQTFLWSYSHICTWLLEKP